MIKLFTGIGLLVLVLSACQDISPTAVIVTEKPTTAATIPVQTGTPSPSGTAAPSSTPEPTGTAAAPPQATATETPQPVSMELTGMLFFDMNGNGLQDRREPGLPGFEVCIEDLCVVTDEDGMYRLDVIGVPGQGFCLAINRDPNEGIPEQEMRYISVFKRMVTIPRFDVNGVNVPIQELFDAEVYSIDDLVMVWPGSDNQIGLMQGFLTLPFTRKEQPEPTVWNYFDVLDSQVVDPEHALDSDQAARSYDGQYSECGSGSQNNLRPGVCSGSSGIDYAVPPGTAVVHAGPTARVWKIVEDPESGEVTVEVMFEDFSGGPGVFLNTYGPLAEVLINEVGTLVYRGQLIGRTGEAASESDPPHLNFRLVLFDEEAQRYQYLDPYRTIAEPGGQLPDNFAGSLAGYWIVDNSPTHSQ